MCIVDLSFYPKMKVHVTYYIFTLPLASAGMGPYWSDLTEDVENLVELYREAATAIKGKAGDWLRETAEHDIAEKATKGKTTLVWKLSIFYDIKYLTLYFTILTI